MDFDNNDFLKFLNDNLPMGSSNFFEINPQSILGRNKILNFLGIIGFEVGTLGFSNNANEIAEFYDTLKSKYGLSGVKKFYENSVIKSILTEMKSMPTVQRYLNERIFDLIEQDTINTLNDLFKNSEKIFKKNKEQDKKQQVKKENKIKKNKSSSPKRDEHAFLMPNSMDLEDLFQYLQKLEQEGVIEQGSSSDIELNDNIINDEDNNNNEFFNL